MFLDNKYTKYYYDIINRVKSREIVGYSERHHIIPKCIGGSNDALNIVKLTAREHFICHRLLIKMVDASQKHKMAFAAWQQGRSAKYHNVKITARTYAVLKEQLSITYKGKRRAPFSDKAKENMKIAAKTRKKQVYNEQQLEKLRSLGEQRRGQVLSAEHKEKISKANKGKVLTDTHKEKIRESKIGHKHTAETVEKIKSIVSEKYSNGLKNGMLGKKHTEESLSKMRDAKKGVENLHRNRPIKCITTGETFSSVKLASTHLNIPSSYISSVLTGLQKSTKGYSFEYV